MGDHGALLQLADRLSTIITERLILRDVAKGGAEGAIDVDPSVFVFEGLVTAFGIAFDAPEWARGAWAQLPEDLRESHARIGNLIAALPISAVS